MLAADYGHKAYEVVDPDTCEPSGVLTRIVMKAIRDRCAIDPQGRITPDWVRLYIGSNLTELIGRAGNRRTLQSPNCSVTPSPSFLRRS